MRDLLEILLAVVLMIAAVGKIVDGARWRRSLSGYRVRWIDVGAVAALVPMAELVTAVILLLGVEPVAAIAASVLFVSFAAVLGLAYLRGARGNCDCFGELLPSSISPGAVLRALTLAGVAVAMLGPWAPAAISIPVRLAFAVTVTLAVALIGEWLTLQRA